MKNLFSCIAALTGFSIVSAAAAFIISVFADGVAVIILYSAAVASGIPAIVFAVTGIIKAYKYDKRKSEVSTEEPIGLRNDFYTDGSERNNDAEMKEKSE